MHAQLVSFIFFFFIFLFFWYYCFLIVYTKIFVVYLYKIACTSSNQFTSYCTCVFPPPPLHSPHSIQFAVIRLLPCFALRFSTFSSTRKTTKSNEQLQILLCTISDWLRGRCYNRWAWRKWSEGGGEGESERGRGDLANSLSACGCRA